MSVKMRSTVFTNLCGFPMSSLLLLGVIQSAFSIAYLPTGGVLNCVSCNGTRCASMAGVRAEPCRVHAGYDGEPVRCLTFRGLECVVSSRIRYPIVNGIQRMCATREFMKKYFGDSGESGSKTALSHVTTVGVTTFCFGDMHYCSDNACNNGPDVNNVPVEAAARPVRTRKRILIAAKSKQLARKGQCLRSQICSDPICSSTHSYTCPNIPGDEYDSTPIRCMKFTGTLVQETPSGMVIYAINTTQRSCATRGFVRSFGATVYRNNCQNVTNFRIRNKDIVEHWTRKMCSYSDDNRAYNAGNILSTSFLVFALTAFLSHVSSIF